MRLVTDRHGTRWECSDLGLPTYAHPDADAPDETPRVPVTAVSPRGRRCLLAPLTWESGWTDRELLRALQRSAPASSRPHRRRPHRRRRRRAAH